MEEHTFSLLEAHQDPLLAWPTDRKRESQFNCQGGRNRAGASIARDKSGTLKLEEVFYYGKLDERVKKTRDIAQSQVKQVRDGF
jgi:hypothetical protein